MNERIRLLAEQAGMYIVDDKFSTYGKFAEKFAELIVQEAADIAKHHVMNSSTYADADFVDEQIKQHFGVE